MSKNDAFDPGVILAPGIASVVASHPLEHALYGKVRADGLTAMPGVRIPTFGGKGSGKFFKGFKPVLLDKSKTLQHLALRAPKSMLASVAAFGTYNILKSRKN